MKLIKSSSFLIVTHVFHKKTEGKYFGYAPYVKEMNLWISNFQRVILLAPVEENSEISPIQISYNHPNFTVIPVPNLDFTTIEKKIKSLFCLPEVIFKMYSAMKSVDHIHLRCPGNMGLLGCLVQIFFPKKKKTVKYAGNWDPDSIQPFTYRLQRYLLNSPLIFKNTKVLVYGRWEDSAPHVLSFFTASYSRKDIEKIEKKNLGSGLPIRLLFVGSLIKEKNPIIALKSLHLMVKNNMPVHMDFCGEGDQYQILKNYIKQHELERFVNLRGNVSASELKGFYKNSHFLIFLSDSEGWPKVVAESMFFGCVPITTPVSCVPDMLNFGERGELTEKDPHAVNDVIFNYQNDFELFKKKSERAYQWSTQYTLEYFEDEIKMLV